MFTNVRLRNFKAWQDTGDVRLAPLTVFFGANSAGKTSLLQFILLLKQTSESPDRQRVLNTGDSSSLVELGTFENVIFRHDLRRSLSFDLSWGLPYSLKVKDPLSDREFVGDRLSFSAKLASVGEVQHVDMMSYKLSNNESDALSLDYRRKSSKTSSSLAKYDLSSINYPLKKLVGRPWPFSEPTRFYGFPEEVIARHQNAAFTSDLVLSIEQQLKRIGYLGPLRKVPNRTYSWAGDAPEHVGADGAATISALLAGADQTLNSGPRKRLIPLQLVVAGWLQRLGLLKSFRARKISTNRKEYEVRVQALGSLDEVDLPDVGFGISQVLPVVVESFYAPPHSTVIIEQPELHLHPRVQAELGDLFIEAIQSRRGGEKRAVQFIIESHSEHLLQRIQRRVAEGSVRTEDVALYFCSPGSEGSKIQELDVNMFGEIRNWPQDFFGDPMSDIYARIEAASHRSEAE